MDINAAYREVGTYRGAAEICGTTAKTVKRIVEAAERTDQPGSVVHNYDDLRSIVVERVAKTQGRITAKRLLPIATAARYTGSARNFRRLVADAKATWRVDHHRGRRPEVWAPGDVLVFDWGEIGPLYVFCAVLAWSRSRFVSFADNLSADATLAALAACFEELGGVPTTALTDRMGCLKGGTVAEVVVPTANYVRFATHYGFRPDFCEGQDPASKGLAENLVGYAKTDLMIPAELTVGDLAAANTAGRAWCVEVNAAVHSEIAAVPAERLVSECQLLGPLPSLRAQIGKLVIRNVDRLSCIRFGSARYSVPTRHIGKQVEVRVTSGVVQVVLLGAVIAEHVVVSPGEASVNDDHYGGARPAARRAVRARDLRSHRVERLAEGSRAHPVGPGEGSRQRRLVTETRALGDLFDRRTGRDEFGPGPIESGVDDQPSRGGPEVFAAMAMKGSRRHGDRVGQLHDSDPPVGLAMNLAQHGGLGGVAGPGPIGRRVGRLAPAPQRHHDVSAHRQRHVGAAVLLHQRQRQIHPRRHPARGPDVVVAHHQAVAFEHDRRVDGRQQIPPRPVGGGPSPGQQPQPGQHERPAAHRGDALGVAGGRPDRRQHRPVGEQRHQCLRRRSGHDERVDARPDAVVEAAGVQGHARRRGDLAAGSHDIDRVGPRSMHVGLGEHVARPHHVETLNPGVDDDHDRPSSASGSFGHEHVIPANAGARIDQLGLTIPDPFPSFGSYVMAVIDGTTLYTSGHVPFDGTALITGKLGDDLSIEEGAQAARLAALSLLATLRAELGRLSRVRQILHVTGTVNAAPHFVDHTAVIDGASDLLVDVFATRGQHARLAVGVNSLPADMALEVQAVIALHPRNGDHDA